MRNVIIRLPGSLCAQGALLESDQSAAIGEPLHFDRRGVMRFHDQTTLLCHGGETSEKAERFLCRGEVAFDKCRQRRYRSQAPAIA